jgi:hypothetical protein
MSQSRARGNSYTLPTSLSHQLGAADGHSGTRKSWKSRLGLGVVGGDGTPSTRSSSSRTGTVHGVSSNETGNESFQGIDALAGGQVAGEAAMEQLQMQHSRASRKTAREPKWWKVRLFRGMVNDVRRRAPFYWSDWVDAWDYRVVPATVYMYFAK